MDVELTLGMFQVEIEDGKYYYVIAYSEEHALIIVSEMLGVNPNSIGFYQSAAVYDRDNVVINNNYFTKSNGIIYFSDLLEEFKKQKVPKCGVISDNFINRK